MKLYILPIIAALMVAATSLAEACMFDTDCYPGSRCAKSDGQLYGYCVSGTSPGNSYDSHSWDNPRDYSGTRGNTCMFVTDCSPGQRCVKSAGSLYGTCL